MPREQLPVRVDDLGLSAKEQKFILEYISNSFDGKAAAKKAKIIPADMSDARANLIVHSLLAKDIVVQAINRVSEYFIAPYKSKFVNQTLRQLDIRANYDLSWYYYPDYTAKPLDEISMEHRWAIDKVEPKVFGKDANVREVVFILADKNAARKELKELLEKKDDRDGGADDGMRSKLSEIFEAVKLGKQLAEKKKEPEMVPAPEQKTILRTPAELRERITNGEKV